MGIRFQYTLHILHIPYTVYWDVGALITKIDFELCVFKLELGYKYRLASIFKMVSISLDSLLYCILNSVEIGIFFKCRMQSQHFLDVFVMNNTPCCPVKYVCYC